MKTGVHLENLTVDVYTQLGHVLDLWKSATYDSLAGRNSLDLSPNVKHGDRNVLKRRTCEAHKYELNASNYTNKIQVSLLRGPLEHYLEIWFSSHINIQCVCSGTRPQHFLDT